MRANRVRQFANKGTGSNAMRGSMLSALGEATGAAVQSGKLLLIGEAVTDRAEDAGWNVIGFCGTGSAPQPAK